MIYPAGKEQLTIIFSEDVDFFCLLEHILKREGFRSVLVKEIDGANGLGSTRDCNAIVLDCRTDPAPASNLCAGLRNNQKLKQTPVVVLMGSGAEREQVRLMERGFREILTQPVFPQKLIEALHRVTGKAQPNNSDSIFKFVDVELDTENYRVKRGKRDIHLGPIEFRMLQHFMQHPDQVFSRKELVEAVWDKDASDGSRIVDVHMGKLRKALSVDGEHALFRTIRGIGYALSPKTDDE